MARPRARAVLRYSTNLEVDAISNGMSAAWHAGIDAVS
jgi:hypothetical protein